MSTIEIENSLGISFSDRLPLAFTHGKGSRVWDEAGKEYLDFTSGWGVTCLGHSHPLVVEALYAQAQKMMQGPNAGFTYSPQRAELLRTMRTVLPAELTNIYFCNSGAEANDAALKLVRKITGRSKVVSTLGSFHGRSFATLAVSRGPENPARFTPKQADTIFVPYGDINALMQVMDNSTAALIVEPVQGEGGVQIPASTWLTEARNLCRQHGALLIVDEVQTGFCRTGSFFAHQQQTPGLVPDVMTMAKGIAGGFPFAAFALTTEVYAQLALDDHGGTYCGNPLGCAVANAVVTYLRDNNVAALVQHKGAVLLQGMHLLQQRFTGLIKGVRGMGLLCALELHEHSLVRQITKQCAQVGLLVVPTRNGIIRLLPDLLISESDINEALFKLENVLLCFDTSTT